MTAQLTKTLFDTVKKGDIAAVIKQEERLGLEVHYLVDVVYNQNAMFTAALIKNEAQAVEMCKWLAAKGAKLNFTDPLE